MDADGLDDGPAGADRHAGRLLAVDVLARPDGEDRVGCGGMVGSGDQHGVDVVAEEHVADVPIGAAALVGALAELPGIVPFDAGLAFLGPLPLHVADAQHLDVVAAEVAAGQVGPGPAEEVAAALPAESDEPHIDPLTGRRSAVETQHRGRN